MEADSKLQPDAFVAFNRWLKALESSNLPSDPLVEPLALGAYRRGLFDLCSKYLRLAPTESLNRAWLASKCAFREGDLEKAYEELTLAARLFPDQDKPMTDQTASSETEVHHGLWLPHQRLWGELGMLTLQRGDYLEAMKTLLNAGYWMDGAYIAEQMRPQVNCRLSSIRSIRSIVSPMSSMKAFSGVGLTPWANPGQKKF